MTVSQPSVERATEICRKAIEKHGRPAWVIHVPYRIRDLVPMETLHELLATGRRARHTYASRAMGREAILEWCKSNVFELVSVRHLTDIGGISQSSVRALIQERPDIFKKTDGRVYEIRDPKADREIDKRKKGQ